jgi:hypothetical protein
MLKLGSALGMIVNKARKNLTRLILLYIYN